MTPNCTYEELKGYNKILKKLKVSHIVIDIDPYNHFHKQFFNEMNNENLFLLIVKNMSLGIIMNETIAFKFDYIKKIINQYSSYKTIFNYKIKIVEIDKQWDTSLWNYSKLKSFHQMMYDVERWKKPLDYYKNNNIRTIYNSVDPYFLEALSWNMVEEPSNAPQDYNNTTFLEPEPVIVSYY
jgi:hypothetical protein